MVPSVRTPSRRSNGRSSASRYTSEAQIRIGGQNISDPFRDPKVGSPQTSESAAIKVDKEAIASQVVALRSRDLADKLANELKLA